MGFRFATPNKAVQAKAPDYVRAVIEQQKLDDQAKAQANALRSQQMGGAAELYNAGMGDNTPIADAFGSMGDTPASAQNMDLGLEGYDSGQGGVEAVEASQTMEGADVLNEGSMLADLNAAADASELTSGAADLASIADAGTAVETLAGAGEVAGGAEAVLGAGEAAAAAQAATAASAAGTAGTAAAGAAGGGGLMATLGAANPYIAAALAAYSLFS